MSDVVLIMLPTYSRVKLQPLGLCSLASSLEKEGIDVEIIDLNVSPLNYEKLLKFLLIKNTRIVGITAHSTQINEAVKMAKYFKDNGLESKIVLGGPHVTLCPDFVKKFKMFDYGFVGEGELTFPGFAKKILKGKTPKNKIIRGKRPENLNDLPLPAYHLLEMKKYFLAHIGDIGKNFSAIFASRGCAYKCNFCNIPNLCGNIVRFKSTSKTIEEIKMLKESHGINYFTFMDDTFTFNNKYVKNLCKNIIKEKVDIQWTCVTRCDYVDGKLLKIMHNAGCRIIGFGVETASDENRFLLKSSIIKKNVIIKAFNLCNEIGIDTILYLMFGYPNETLKSINDTLKFSISLNPSYVYLNPTYILPKTPIFQIALKEGKITRESWDNYARGSNPVPMYIPDSMDYKMIEKLIMKSFLTFWIRPNHFFKSIKKLRSIHNFNATLFNMKELISYTILYKKMFKEKYGIEY